MELVFQMLNVCLGLVLIAGRFDRDGTRSLRSFQLYILQTPWPDSLSPTLPLLGDSLTLQGLHKFHKFS